MMRDCDLRAVPHRAFSLVLVSLALELQGCHDASPVAATHCEVERTGTNSVTLRADLFNASAKSVVKTLVLVSTHKGGFAEYPVSAIVAPGRSQHIKASKDTRSDTFDAAHHLGNVNECYVHAVYYWDGTIWIGPSPL